MRRIAPDVAIRSEIGFDDDLMRRLIEGTLDIGLMYTPRHSPGLIVEHLFDDTLILVSSRKDDTKPNEEYVYVAWGPHFYAQHAQSDPDLERPPHSANVGWLGVQMLLINGGSCFLAARMCENYTASGALHRVQGSPEFVHPAYVVYPRETENSVIAQGLQLLRELV